MATGATEKSSDQGLIADEETAASTRLSHWPDLTFHYGLSFSELAKMPNAIRYLYEEALDRLLADKQMRDLEVIGYPHMKDQDRDKLWKKLQRALHGGQLPTMKMSSDAEMSQQAVAMGIGIQLVDSEGRQVGPDGEPLEEGTE